MRTERNIYFLYFILLSISTFLLNLNMLWISGKRLKRRRPKGCGKNTLAAGVDPTKTPKETVTVMILCFFFSPMSTESPVGLRNGKN